MSRYDQPTQEPDYDRYDEKPVDVQDEPADGESWAKITVHSGGGGGMSHPTSLNHIIDPAEYAAHAIIDALAMFEQELAMTMDLARVQTLKNLLKRAYASVDAVDLKASVKCDEILERRR